MTRAIIVMVILLLTLGVNIFALLLVLGWGFPA